MKYTADLFLLPDGSPIASMLNNWAGAPDVGSKLKHSFTPSGRYITAPMLNSRANEIRDFNE